MRKTTKTIVNSKGNKKMGLEEDNKIITEKELQKDGYNWSVYSEDVTGLRLVALEDPQTGVTITTTIANPLKRTAAHRAWAGARHSRAPGAPWEIMVEMGEKGVDPDQKLDDTFRNYGHKSVGDMARLEISTIGMPMHLCLALFNIASINGGQEKSSRYQSKFKQAVLHPMKNYLPENLDAKVIDQLEEKYQAFGNTALDLYSSFRDKITPAFEAYFKPEENHKGALSSRVMDCVRFFLPLGTCSGMSIDTSARDWSRIISEFKASSISFYQRFGFQIEQLFTPSREIEEDLSFKAEAPSLIRHSEASETVNNNIRALHKLIEEKTEFLSSVAIGKDFRGMVKQDVELLPDTYTEAERMVAQYLLTIWPGADKDQILDWVAKQDPKLKQEIGQTIFAGHNHNHEVPLWTGTTKMTLVLEGFLGEVRDWNRHRANKRFIPLPLIFGEKWSADTALQIINKGFGLPLYLSEISEFSDLAGEFASSLNEYYSRLTDFVYEISDKHKDITDYSFVLNLLPLAHQTDIWMHGDPKQSLYLTHLRVRPGGHINYRDLAYRANQLVADSDPYLASTSLDKKPDPANREEFFDRS